MKHFFTTLLLTITSIACTAQIEQFTFAVSSSFSFSKENSEAFDGITNQKYTSKNVNLQPKIGFFALKRFCIGVYMPYTWNKNSNQVSDNLISKSLGVGPFVRYYQPLAKNLYGILGLGYSWNKDFTEFGYLDQFTGDMVKLESERKVEEFQKSLGFAYFINKNIAVEMTLDHSKQINAETDRSPMFYTNFQDGITLSLGLQIYLTKNRE